MASDAFKSTINYKNQLIRLIGESVLEKIAPEVGTFTYMQLNYGGSNVTYLRLFNQAENLIYLIHEESFIKKLKYMNTELMEFYERLEEIGYSLYW
jgi:hypothetical protein